MIYKERMHHHIIYNFSLSTYYISYGDCFIFKMIIIIILIYSSKPNNSCQYKCERVQSILDYIN